MPAGTTDQCGKRGDKSGVIIGCGHAEVAWHTETLRQVTVIDVQLHQRLRMVRDKGNRYNEQRSLVMRGARYFVLGTWRKPALRSGARLITQGPVTLLAPCREYTSDGLLDLPLVWIAS